MKLVYFGTKNKKATFALLSFKKDAECYLKEGLELNFSSPVFKNNASSIPILEETNEKILALFVEEGDEYYKLKEKGKTVSRALITTDSDFQEALKAILKEDEKGRILLVFHGNTLSDSLYSSFTLPENISIATIHEGKFCYKSLEIKEERVTIIPFLLTLSHHSAVDIARINSFLESQGKSIFLREKALLEHDGIKKMFFSRFKAIM